MKIAKSSKILFLLTALLLSVVLAFSFAGAKSADAASVNVSDYFGGTASVEIKNDKLSVTADNDQTLIVKNKLAIDDFKVSFDAPDGLDSVTLTVSSPSYFGSGVAENEGDSAITDVKNEIVLDYKNGKFSLNGEEKVVAIKNQPVGLSVDKEGTLSVTVNGKTVQSIGDLKRIGGKGKTPAELEFKFGTNKSGVVVAFDYFDQGASVVSGEYKQTFDSAKLDNKAFPRVALKDSFGAKNDNTVNVINGKEYSLSFTYYSLLGWSDSFSLARVEGDETDNVWLSNETNPDDISITVGATVPEAKFTVRSAGKVIETFTATVYDKNADVTAPVYNESSYALNAFKTALVKATLKEYTVKENGEEKTVLKHVKLGDKITIPSMRGLVSDDYTSYDNLSHTIYYRTPSSASGSTDGWTITLTDVGTYQFYIVFKDEAGNAMEKDGFYKVEDDGTITKGSNYGYVFTFTVEDDAPIYVYAPASQSAGYLNTQYTFSAFTVEASGYTPTYKLLYSQTKDGEYKEIEKASSLPSDKDKYTGEDFTYDEIKDFAYDGKLTFTPIKKGFYKVVCTVSSTKTVRFDSAESQIVEISKKPTVVKPDSHWLQNNVWSVVFLSIGTLCLIGIVVLLFIKPKEETGENEAK